MKKTYKWIASMVIACSIISLGAQPFVHADWKNTVYQESNSEYIAKGVKYENILKFTDQGWLNMNVLRADLNERDNSLQVLLHNNGIGTKGKLSELVNQDQNIVGAVNGDFFNMNSTETLGPVVQNGELITTPFYMPDKTATFNMSMAGDPFITYWINPQLDLNNKSHPAMLTFMAINKNSNNADTAILYNSAWGEKTPPPPKNATNAIEAIVENNKIREIVPSKDGSIIPKDGYIIWAAGSFAEHLQQYFFEGDEVELAVTTTPDFNELALTLGGGATIVKNGIVPAAFSHNIAGNQPRTAIGITQDKKEVIFLTIDGRTSSYPGVSQKELGEIMISLGAYEAINLDGGGSTEMIVRTQGDNTKQIVNNLSGGTERSLMNGIGIVNTSPKTNALKDIKLETKDTSVFVDTSRQFTLKAYDQNYNPMEVDYRKVKWYISGVKGSFEGNVFRPSTSGKGIVGVEYKGAYTTMEIKVLDNPVALTLSPSTLTIGTNSKRLIQVTAVDNEGYKASVNFRDLKLDIPGDLGTVDKDGYFVSSGQGGSGIIKASLGELTTDLPAAVGLNQTIVNNFESNNATFLSYPAEVSGSYDLASISKSGKSSGKLSYDFTATDATRAAYMVFADGGITFEQRPSRLGMWVYGSESGSHWIRAKLTGADGTSINLDLSSTVDWAGWKYIETAVPTTLQSPVKLERVYLVETDPAVKSKGAIYIDDLTVIYPISLPDAVTNTQEKVPDSREVKAELQGDKAFRFTAHGAVTNINTLLDNLAVQKLTQIANEDTAISIFTDAVDTKVKDQLKNTLIQANGGYTFTKHENSIFMQLDNSKGGLRETNFDQWSWFLETADVTNAENVFILLPKPLSFKDKLEEKLFKETLQNLKESKNADVWVLHGGKDEFKVTLDEGIRYVSLASYPESSGIDIFTQLKYMLFTVNSDKVTYEILPLYTK